MSCNYYGLIPLRSDPPRFSASLLPSTRPIPLHPLPRSIRIRTSNPPKFSASYSSTTVNDAVKLDVGSLSFYDLLGIPETGSLLEIKQAYKQLARKYHPDVSPPDRVEEYTQRFIQVQEAYETLSDPNRRALYDRDMANGLHFAFSARRRCQRVDEQMEDRNEWKRRWNSQLSELKRRSAHKDSGNDMSWGARMRRQRNESSS